MQRKDPEITNNERIHILTFRAHFKFSALLFPSFGNHKMIHKKGGRIRTYGRPTPDLTGCMFSPSPSPWGIYSGIPHPVRGGSPWGTGIPRPTAKPTGFTISQMCTDYKE
ncbi:hypothetical protein ACS0TY_020166 [Phlomoides rotata]